MTITSDRPLVYLITSGECTQANFSLASNNLLDLMRVAVATRVSMVQIREKQLEGRQLFELVSGAVALAKGSETKVLVNDRTDVAIAAGADGVHLPSNGYSPQVAKQIGGQNFIVGVSTHNLKEVDFAVNGCADYVVFGPVFDTPGKSRQGIESLEAAVKGFPGTPILGLGGIGEHNIAAILGTGAAGFAAIRYLNDKENLRNLADVVGTRVRCE